ncbi:MAG: hypothetical protein AAGA29_05845 [Planctomycetota bacterium]
MPPSDKQLAELMQQLRSNANLLGKAQQQLTQTTTVVRQHIQEQKAINARMERMVSEQETRLRELEQWRAGIDQKLPATLVDGEELHDDMEHIRTTVDGLKWRIASWSGGIAVLVVIGGWVVKGVFGG